jgi:hypothetical protein
MLGLVARVVMPCGGSLNPSIPFVMALTKACLELISLMKVNFL